MLKGDSGSRPQHPQGRSTRSEDIVPDNDNDNLRLRQCFERPIRRPIHRPIAACENKQISIMSYLLSW